MNSDVIVMQKPFSRLRDLGLQVYSSMEGATKVVKVAFGMLSLNRLVAGIKQVACILPHPICVFFLLSREIRRSKKHAK